MKTSLRPRYPIRFPPNPPHALDQDEAWFLLDDPERGEETVRFHDYGRIFARPGLYEQLFYDRLKCQSPTVVAERLERAVRAAGGAFSELRCVDVGAGNGMMGEELQRRGMARIVGVDILPDAKAAAERDRPGAYDAYYVGDLNAPSAALLEELASWHFDCLASVAALGFGDASASVFLRALGLIQVGGWVAFNIKDSFLHAADATGFSRMIREMILGDALELHHLERYRHRISIDGRALHYYAVVARKVKEH